MTPGERAAEILDSMPEAVKVVRCDWFRVQTFIADAIRAAVMEEREACAVMFDVGDINGINRHVARIIRERPQP